MPKSGNGSGNVLTGVGAEPANEGAPGGMARRMACIGWTLTLKKDSVTTLPRVPLMVMRLSPVTI